MTNVVSANDSSSCALDAALDRWYAVLYVTVFESIMNPRNTPFIREALCLTLFRSVQLFRFAQIHPWQISVLHKLCRTRDGMLENISIRRRIFVIKFAG